jgi:hypothetical protein
MIPLEFVIAVTLDPAPKVISMPKEATAFEDGADRFEDIGLGVLNGFYDFLRESGGGIIGIRFMPYPDAEFLLTSVRGSHRLRVARQGLQGTLTIYFGDDVAFDSSVSIDQYFGDNAIYRSLETGRFAISFGLDTLSPAETASLLRYTDSSL